MPHQEKRPPKPPKPHKTYKQQINILKSRGMAIGDEERAIKKLSHLGYYRLSGYWYTARKKDLNENNKRLDSFEEGTTFEDMYKLYLFDKDLRIQLFCGLERIENIIKAVVAYELGRESHLAYFEENFFLTGTVDQESKYKKLRNKMDHGISRSKEDFIKWNRDTYNDIPIWVACDIWDFGTLSNLYKQLKQTHQKVICEKLNISNTKDLVNCLHVFNIVRNRCAHNARLWNYSINVSISKNILSQLIDTNNMVPSGNRTRLFNIILVIWFFIKKMSNKSDWLNNIICHLENKPNLPNVNYLSMGFPSDNIDELIELL